MGVRIGVDAGGTFTDVCLVGEDGLVRVFKLPSTPADPSEAIAAGAAAMLHESGRGPDDVDLFAHGTTVSTNALLERKLAPTGLITTQGFRDLLELGRQRRPDLYDLQVDKPDPLVRRALRFEVPERVHASGNVLIPLDVDATERAIDDLAAAEVEAVAVCFLYSYLRPDHEDEVGALLADRLPGAYVSLSHDVVAEFREYERLSTTVVNAALGPVMSGYVRRLRQRLNETGIEDKLYITQSNGGTISIEAAAALPVRTVLSGPAAGVSGAIAVAETAGFGDVVSFDMGGTSTDVALVNAGRCALKAELELAGYPIKAPMLDIQTVGAGGGSVAWLDSGGHLQVGPRSAAAEPGPACYGRGGEEATVTDANVALGVLSRQALLGGRMPIAAELSDRAIDRLATRLGLGAEAVAQGIVELATANMVRAIRVISVERGYDPRDYAMVAFGGAGPLHAARLARELEIPRIVVPPYPGILCALGLLVADLRTDRSRTLVLPAVEASLPALNDNLAELAASAAAWLDAEAIQPEQRQVRRTADMRYVGQNYELSIPLPGRPLTPDDLGPLLDAFHAAHDQAYGYAAPDAPTQVVTLRLEATATVEPPAPARLAGGGRLGDALVAERRAYLPETGGWTTIPVYDRSRLRAGMTFGGPAVVEQMDATTLVLPGQGATVDDFGNVILVDTTQEAAR
jgi:N-methylhydantoinase A